MKDRSVRPMQILSLSIILCLIACTVSLIVLLIRGVDQDLKHDHSCGGESHVTTLSVTPDYGQSYIDSIIFICDSSFANIKEHGLLSGGTDTRQIWTNSKRDLPLEYTVDSATIIFPETSSETPITSAAKDKKPAYVVITIGINNGVPHCTESSFKEYYSKLVSSIKEASPETKIILQSIFPISKEKEKTTANVSISKIDAANEWISDVAREHSVRYLDTASALKNGKGYLKSEYDSGDGLHLNSEGYSKVLEYIRTHGYK